jgi:hypothetical protein
LSDQRERARRGITACSLPDGESGRGLVSARGLFTCTAWLWTLLAAGAIRVCDNHALSHSKWKEKGE